MLGLKCIAPKHPVLGQQADVTTEKGVELWEPLFLA